MAQRAHGRKSAVPSAVAHVAPPSEAPHSPAPAEPAPSAGLLRHVFAWLLVVLAGASLFGGWRLWGFPLPSPFTLGALKTLLPAVGWGALAALAGGLIFHGLAGKFLGLAPVDRLQALSWGAPLALLAWIPVGGLSENGRVWTILWIALLGGAGALLGLGRVAARLRLPEVSTRAALWILGSAVVLFGASYAWTSILGFQGLYNASYTDLGGFHNAMWNTLRGRLMQCDHWSMAPGAPGILLKDHFCFFLVLLSPVLLICEQTEILFLIQSFTLAAAAVPLYLTARREVPSFFALLLALAFLLSPFLNRVALYEFHDLAFATLTLTLLLWACHGSVKNWQFLLLGLLALTVREDMAIPVLFVGLWEALGGRRPLRGGALVLMALAWGVLCINCFMPSANAGRWTWQAGGSGHMERYTHLGTTYGGIVKTLLAQPKLFWQLLTAPEKLPNYFLLFLPLLFLPWLSPLRLLAILPIFLLHALSNWRYQNQLDCQYTAPILPLLFFAASGGAAVLARRFRQPAPPSVSPAPEPGNEAAASAPDVPLVSSTAPVSLEPRPAVWVVLGGGVFMLSLLTQLFFARWQPGLPPALSPYDGSRHMDVAAFPWRAEMWSDKNPSVPLFHALCRVIPPRAPVGVPDACAPHMTARPLVRAFRRLNDKPMDDLDYVLFAARIPVMVSGMKLATTLQKLLTDPAWALVLTNGDLYLFARLEKVTPKVQAGLNVIKQKYGIAAPIEHQMRGMLAEDVGLNDLMLEEARITLQLDKQNKWALGALGRTP